MNPRPIIHSLVLAALVLTAGCAGKPKTWSEPDFASRTIHQVCRVRPAIWSQIPPPANRDELMNIELSFYGKPIEDIFQVGNGVEEAWFAHTSEDKLQVCQYDVGKRGCNPRGTFRFKTFFLSSDVWKLGDGFVDSICT